jgi:APA family basic amino acid/polyamine antiporter
MSARAAHRFGLRNSTLLVIASMVGTGVFTTSGILLREIPSIPALLLVWATGGLIATAGALSYAELAASDPESGGEYALLTRSMHPAVGFCAGIVSIVAGFAAPIAACAIAFARYAAAVVPGVPETPAAIWVVLVASGVHALHARVGAWAQDAATVLKIVLVVAFLVAGALRADLSRLAEPLDLDTIVSPSFAVGLVFVYFAYSGWNAAAYIAGEVERPARTLPLALAIGTLSVTAIYVALNAVFLASAPREKLSGVVEIGHLAATGLLGPTAASVLSAIVAIGLVSTIGALVVTGARVYEAIGRDYPRLAILARRSASGAPLVTLAIQAALAIAMILTASFDLLLGAVGFTLSIGSGLTVVGLFVQRLVRPDHPRGYRVPLYPWTPLCFVAAMAWTVAQAIATEPAVALAGLSVVFLGWVGYLVLARIHRQFRSS